MIDLDYKAGTDWTSDVLHPGGRATSRRTTVVAGLLIALGLGLVAAPAVFGMFTRAPQGATMLRDFEPFMTGDRLAGYSEEIATIDSAVAELDATAAPELSPSYAAFSEQWPTINQDMSGLMRDVTDNLGNYQAVAALPSFSMFPWFFVIPGGLIVGVAGVVLHRRRWTRPAAVVVGLLGLGLIAAPVAFGMFERAPKGGEMMAAFQNLETTENVTRIQGYFSSMAVGQGAVRLEVVPALAEQGLTAQDLPATTRLNEGWVHILNDMTPMIGVMSDNVDNYDALVALPPFALFPWFFLVPGVLIVVLVLTAGAPVRRTSIRGAR